MKFIDIPYFLAFSNDIYSHDLTQFTSDENRPLLGLRLSIHINTSATKQDDSLSLTKKHFMMGLIFHNYYARTYFLIKKARIAL